MNTSGRIQKKINRYAVVFKAMGILSEEELNKITEKKQKKNY
ncbi:hypothetical protein ACQCVK_06985 [Rossellomorea vietnamensis]|nr:MULTISPECIES: hypothetical protein [Rossellomorea]